MAVSRPKKVLEIYLCIQKSFTIRIFPHLLSQCFSVLNLQTDPYFVGLLSEGKGDGRWGIQLRSSTGASVSGGNRKLRIQVFVYPHHCTQTLFCRFLLTYRHESPACLYQCLIFIILYKHRIVDLYLVMDRSYRDVFIKSLESSLQIMILCLALFVIFLRIC